MVRLRDVAERAGVSVKTVSNVVHDYEHVRPETRTRVQRAIDELGYRPNLTARGLRKGRTGVVALAVPTLEMPYFAELASLVVAAAAERGLTVLVDQTDGHRDRELEIVSGLAGRLIDGLLMSPMSLDRDDLDRRRTDVPTVLLGERLSGGPVDHLAVDNVAAARAATEHLLQLGRRRVAALGYQDAEHAGSGVSRLRSRGYVDALAAAGLDLDPALTPVVSGYRRVDGAAGMAGLLALPAPPDAVFCFNDLLALGALRALAERGMRVPEDVAVIGFDDVEDGRFSTPTLSTIAPDKATLAARAVALLAERIEDVDAAPPRELHVDFTLVARESTTGRSAPSHEAPP